jgi:hypothetical protein
MRVEVGGVGYELRMVDGEVRHPDGSACNGLTWPDRGLIEIDGRLPRSVRRKTLWHELGHAFKCELDVTDAAHLDEESLCNLVALALCAISPKLYLRLMVWSATGRDCDEVAYLPGMAEPIPIWRMSDEPPEVQVG